LKPVAEMTHQSARWSADDVDRRFGTDDRPAELEDLAATLDGLLDRLSAVLRHEQQLSSEISHELRTPLARILAEVELHRQRLRPGDPLDASLGVVQSSAQEMSQILETLMAAARSGSGTAPGRCDAAAVLRDLVAARRTPDRVVEVVAPGPVATGVDAEVLVRAVSPVLDNALRFSRREVVVHVATERQVVVITVVDDGPGISDEDLPHVFEPGRRGTGPDPHPGAGLGMSLSRRLIKAAGGSIEATSTDSGALIIIRLPAA
jgi:signal transduction histidine kinase